MFYKTQEFWTASATIVALFMPLIVLWLNSRPKKSNLKFKEISVIHQETDSDDAPVRKLLDVGRLIIKNEGKYKASAVEAYIEKIIFDGEERENFIPIPLKWTHGELNKDGSTVQDIYPNQTVYLDVFNYIFDPHYVGNSIVEFAVAAGHGVDSLSKMNVGESTILITIYQESGQVSSVKLKADWDMKNIPEFSFKFGATRNI